MAINFPEGTQDLPASIAQVDNISVPGVVSTNSTSWTAISGFSNTITTKKASSSILVIVNLGAVTGQGNTHAFRLTRNGTLVGQGNADSNRESHSFRITGYNGTYNNNHCRGTTFVFVDSPGVVANTNLVYGMSCRSETAPMYINRSGQDSNDSNVYNGRSHSSIILLEIQ